MRLSPGRTPMPTAERLYLSATGADSLVCSLCGYGIARIEPPERCPMCQERDAWVPVLSRPFRRRGRAAPH